MRTDAVFALRACLGWARAVHAQQPVAEWARGDRRVVEKRGDAAAAARVVCELWALERGWRLVVLVWTGRRGGGEVVVGLGLGGGHDERFGLVHAREGADG